LARSPALGQFLSYFAAHLTVNKILSAGRIAEDEELFPLLAFSESS